MWDTPAGTPAVTTYRVHLQVENNGAYTNYAAWAAGYANATWDVGIYVWDTTKDYKPFGPDPNDPTNANKDYSRFHSLVTLHHYGTKSAIRIGQLHPDKKYRLGLRAKAGASLSDEVTVDFEIKHRPDMYRLTQYVRGALETYTSGRTECNEWVDRFDRYPLYGEQYTTGPTNVLTFLGTYRSTGFDWDRHNFEKGDFSSPTNGSIGNPYDYTTKHEFQDSGLARGGWAHKGVLFTPANDAANGDTLALGVTANTWGLGGNSSFAAGKNLSPPDVPGWEATFSGWTVKPWVLWVSFGNYHYVPNAGNFPAAGRASPMHATGTWEQGYPIDVFVAFNTPGIIKYGVTAPYIEIQIDEGDESVTGKAHYVGPYDGSSSSSGQRTEIAMFRYTVTAEAASKVDNGWVTLKSNQIVLPTAAYVCRSDLSFISNNCANTSFDVTLPVKITSITQSNVHNGFRYTVTYEQSVKVIGTPYLTATGTSKDGQTTKVVKARYKSGSETRNLVFEYLLLDDDGLGSEPTFSWGWLPPSRNYVTIPLLTNQAPEFMMRFDPWIEEVDDGQGNKTMVERNSYILAKRAGQTTYDWDADRRMPANVPSETWTVNRTATASVGEQTGNQTQELEEPVEVVLRSLVAPTRIASATALDGGDADGDERRARDLRFPTQSLYDCEQSGNPNCGVVLFTYGVLPALDEAVSQTVQDNAVGAYIVTKPGPLDEWERRFRRWLDTPRIGFAQGEQRYFPVPTSPIFDLDLWIIYFFEERGMNSVRLAERPFDPPLTVCLPRDEAPANARITVWDYKEWRWLLLEPVASEDSEQICALTPYVTEFSFVVPEVVPESIPEQEQIP